MIRDLGQRGWVDGVIVPANILAYQAMATPYYVRSFDLPYLIDPMSYVFAREDWFRPEGQMRPSITKLLATHGDAIQAVCEAGSRALRPGDFTRSFLDTLTGATLEFQKRAISESPDAQMSRYDRFLQREARPAEGSAPEVVVAPYFFLERGDPNLPWLEVNLQAVSSLAQASDSVAAVLFYDRQLCHSSARPLLNRVIDAYSGCEASTVFVWADDLPDDFAEPSEGEPDVGRGLAEVTGALASAGKRVFALYGGYFSLLLHRRGMAGISHGMLYTQHKAVQAAGSSAGPPPVRYYFPDFHQFRSIAQAVRIVETAGLGVPCDCSICRGIFRGEPGRIAEFEDAISATRHFMAVRHREAELVARTETADLLGQLDEAYGRWHSVVAGLPNPDSRFGYLMPGLEHLRAWAAALTG